MSATLEVITGPMFCAKTARLMDELELAIRAKKRVLVIKPFRDTRTADYISTRRGSNGDSQAVTMPATTVRSEEELLGLFERDDFDVLGVDEAQFFPLDDAADGKPADTLGWFGRAIRDLIRRRARSDLRIIVTGLDTDYRMEPFGPMPGLLALANRVEKRTAICNKCNGYGANLTQRIVAGGDQILVGDTGEYQARCVMCHEILPP